MNKFCLFMRRSFQALIIFLFLGTLVIGCLAINMLAESTKNLPNITRNDFRVFPTTTTIYDVNGQPVAKLRGKSYRIPVSLEDINQGVQDAVVATEDERFYDHRGIDYWGLGRAVYNDLVSHSQEGASTITQQLVKNTILSPEKSLRRKIREAFLARQMEERFSKREILELYLNLSYFGEGAQGVGAAAKIYFGKCAGELTIPECALLAGLLKNPSRFSPFSHPEAAKDRRNTVLKVMFRNGYLSSDSFAAACAAPLPQKRNVPEDNYPFPFFLDNVITELIQKQGFTQEQVYDGGLQIYTTLDQGIQTALEEVYADPANFPPSNDSVQPQSAMVILEQKTGQVKAMVGGRSHSVRRGFNRATMLKRQPGSTFKPLVVYAPAIEKGYGPGTLLDSSVEAYGTNNDTYAPENMGNVNWGKISMRTALNNSVNTYAVKLLKLIGINEGYSFGKRLGLNSLNSQDKVLGLALGGIETGLSPLELASAYSALANRGLKLDTHVITKVTDAGGKELLTFTPQVQRVMKESTADMVTDMLKSAVESGTGKQAQLAGRLVAGKTGTTQLPNLPEFGQLKQGNKDAWFAGYTPELLGVVWLGYDITDGKHFLNKVYGGSYPATIWSKVMGKALENKPPSSFAPPPADMIAGERRVITTRPKPKETAPATSAPETNNVPVKKPEPQAAEKKPLLNKILSLFH
ncbi:MAG TPA: PBP1A family penicillin-binding protein, partial [Verrucomicrobiae bacterium]|nr:PBP1A family penicillin-binding protein [Verrucomicrobiae bacterium]